MGSLASLGPVHGALYGPLPLAQQVLPLILAHVRLIALFHLPAGHAITPGQHITLTLGCVLNHKPLISKPATNKPDSLKSLNKDSLRADSLRKANNANNNQHSIQI